MQWVRAFSLGFVLWGIFFGLTTLIGYLDILGAFGVRSVLTLFYGFAVYTASKILKPHKAIHAFGYGFVWFVMVIILDSIVTIRFNPALFLSEFQWLAYILMIIFPILAIDKTHRPDVASMTVD